MDTASAFIYGQMSRGKPHKVFDWSKAAQVIRDRHLIGNLKVASAGLRDDWEYTGGKIFQNGQIVPRQDTYTYLSSTWATPELMIDGDIMECWIWENDSPGWDSGTYWPSEALEILSPIFEQSVI